MFSSTSVRASRDFYRRKHNAGLLGFSGFGKCPHRTDRAQNFAPVSLDGSFVLRGSPADPSELLVEAQEETSLLCVGPLLGADRRAPTQDLRRV